MVQEAVQHGRDSRGVAEQFSPVLDGRVRSNQRASASVTLAAKNSGSYSLSEQP